MQQNLISKFQGGDKISEAIDFKITRLLCVRLKSILYLRVVICAQKFAVLRNFELRKFAVLAGRLCSLLSSSWLLLFVYARFSIVVVVALRSYI